ncbi:MAG TPA: DUF58 domain-containing protein [Acidimicrobiales bacterium]|nr:DUF58 domain-containing protein [Acidimicrobiales bacterium]
MAVALEGAVGRRGAGDGVAAARRTVTALRQRAARVGSVTALGASVAMIGVAAFVAGWQLGWRELDVVAATCALVLAGAALTCVGRVALRTDLRLDPPRVQAGDPSAGRLLVTNAATRRSLPVEVELPIGTATTAFSVGSLAAGDEHEQVFVLPTVRRGVIPIGPSVTVRTDPLGLLTRRVSWGSRTELVVHPVVAPLDSLASGLLRDLEGRTSAQVTVSDLAFHSLREYVPGDDRRHVHWRSSARAGHLLVRQFLETRRSTISLIVDDDSDSWADADEYETGMQVTASVAVRAARDGLTCAVHAGGHAARASSPAPLLDATARAVLGAGTRHLPTLVSRATGSGDDTSLALVVTGSHASGAALRAATARLPIEATGIVLRVAPGAAASIATVGDVPMLTVPDLTALAAALRSALPS